VSPARFILAGAMVAGLAGAGYVGWRWRASVCWRQGVPWPAQAMTPDRPWTGPLRAAYEEAQRWPVQQEPVERLARLYLANGFNAEAAVLLPGIISRRPEGLEWVHRLAVLLADNGHLQEAVVLWQGIRTKANAHLPVRIKLADALVKLNREAEAEAIYRELLAAQPGYPYAWYGLVLLDVQHQRWADARDKLRLALAAAPDFYGHYALLETVARHFGDEAGAAEADRHVKRLGRFRDVPDSWVEPAVADCFDPYRLRVDADRLRSEAEVLGGATDLAGALERIDRAIALAPQDAMNYQFLATIQGLRGDETAVAQAYERCLELEPRGVTAYLRYSNLLVRQGKDEANRALLIRATAHCPEDADIASALGQSCAKAGAWPEAAEAFRRLMALRPDLPDIAPKAAMAAFRAGNVETGLQVLRENLRRYPRHEQTLGYLLMDALRRGNAQEARDLMQRLELVAPASSATVEMQRLVSARFGETH
jgi:tetratricopeptide (TPR) repeat protein